MTKLQSKLDLASSYDFQRRHNYIVNYFSKKVPDEAKGRLYRRVIEYIENTPQVVSDFDDPNFFSWFHRSLIKNSFLDCNTESTLPHYCYGRSFNQDEMSVFDSFDLEKQLEENQIFEGLDIPISQDDNIYNAL